MSRTILAVMAGLLCAVAGMRHAASLRGDAIRLNRWVQLLRHLLLLMREGTLSVPEALCAAADTPLPPDRLLRAIAAQLTASPMQTVSDAYKALGGTCTEHTALARMFERLSHGSKESRLLALEQCADEIGLMAATAATKADKDVRLWQTLGLIGGLCLSILLL